MANLVKLAKPRPEAKYLRMETFFDPKVALGQKQSWYPWPYVEGLTLEEATNELAFLATGIYGKPMPAQNGAPIRLVTPWKYGFKSVKSIRRFTFTDTRPVSFWEQLNGREYGFWANVNRRCLIHAGRRKQNGFLVATKMWQRRFSMAMARRLPASMTECSQAIRVNYSTK